MSRTEILVILLILTIIANIIVGYTNYSSTERLESKCKLAYIQTIKTNLMAKDAGLPYDENMTRLKEICGDSYLINKGDTFR